MDYTTNKLATTSINNMDTVISGYSKITTTTAINDINTINNSQAISLTNQAISLTSNNYNNYPPISFEIPALSFSNKAIDFNYIKYCKELNIAVPTIKKVQVLKPGKVLRFTFGDNTVIKTVCINDDVFDFKFAFFLAYAKYYYKDILTIQGIENKAKELMEIKFFNSLVKNGMKIYFNQKKEEEKKEKEEAERKEIRKRQTEKKIRQKRNKREKRINEIAEAIKRSSQN